MTRSRAVERPRVDEPASEVPPPEAGSGAPIILRGASKVYGHAGDAVPALDRVSLDVRAGEFVCLLGASGCGKSTLLNLVAGLDSPTSGTVEVHGGTTLMFQEAALFPWLTARGNVDLALKLRGVPKAQRRTRVDELLETVHLREFDGKRPHELSGGMRQRMIIAMALALGPELLIMDEPTTALDVVVQREILQQIDSLKRDFGFATLFITHDLSLLIEFADRIAIMYAGEIVELTDAATIHDEPRHPYTRGLMESFPPLTGPRTRLIGIPGSPPDLAAPPSGCRFHPRCPLCVPAEPLYDKQVSERPVLREVVPDHFVACHLA